MNQLSFTDAEHNCKRRLTRREKFLTEMEQVVPWDKLLSAIEPHYHRPAPNRAGRRPYPLNSMLHIYFLQQWYGLSDPGMEDNLYEITSMRQFARISLEAIPDETTILNFRRLLEKNSLTEVLFAVVNGHLQDRGMFLRQGTLVDATIIEAPSLTKNKAHQRDPEMHQTKKGNQWHFGMKAHIGVDAISGLVHSLTGTAANVSDIVETHNLLHGDEAQVFADAGYTGIEKREEVRALKTDWQVAMKRQKRKALKEEGSTWGALNEAVEKTKASIRALVEHPFRVIKCQFGLRKTRYRGLAKNTAQLHSLFALANLYMARKRLMAL